jgi:phosphatidylserine/phosphatidylglycerophosphate/cardiolipin synthase-like enzyme
LPFVRDLQASRLPLEWATTHMVSGDPAKGLGRAGDVQVAQRLREIRGASTHELQLISPYFVPTADGVEALAELARSNVDVTILTNSLEATDVAGRPLQIVDCPAARDRASMQKPSLSTDRASSLVRSTSIRALHTSIRKTAS